ncbi:MAG: hypothetical protein EA381_13050 [Planctomycetaceae bacterium]|nr:MAG: hypothetical protein EA381_13050 [Planctomycetaceae bacterium]
MLYEVAIRVQSAQSAFSSLIFTDYPVEENISMQALTGGRFEMYSFKGGKLAAMMRRIGVGRFGLLLVVFMVGCGPSTDGRVPLAGEVLLDGQPLDRGSIEFHPQGEGGTLTGGTIQNGKFEIPAIQGPKPGKYQVRVFAAGDSVAADPNEPPGPEAEQQVSKERVAAKFNVQSELMTDVGDKGEMALKFDVTSN